MGILGYEPRRLQTYSQRKEGIATLGSWSSFVPTPTQMQQSSEKRRRRRSVEAMTAQQLERKRASDRESQRARRDRTRAYISGLEEEVEELKKGTDITTDAMEQLRRQNKALEEEVVCLRERLASTTTIISISTPPAIAQFEPWPAISPNVQQSKRHSSTQVPTAHDQCSNGCSGDNAQWSHINYNNWHPKPSQNADVGSLAMDRTQAIEHGYGTVSSHIPGPELSPQAAENSECQPWPINQAVSSSQASVLTSMAFDNYSGVDSWAGEASYNMRQQHPPHDF